MGVLGQAWRRFFFLDAYWVGAVVERSLPLPEVESSTGSPSPSHYSHYLPTHPNPRRFWSVMTYIIDIGSQCCSSKSVIWFHLNEKGTNDLRKDLTLALPTRPWPNRESQKERIQPVYSHPIIPLVLSFHPIIPLVLFCPALSWEK